MTRRPAYVLLAFLAATPAAAADATLSLDAAANPRLYDTHFGRYGPQATKVVTRDTGGLRLTLPAAPKGAAQTGLYSYFALAGDFEVAVDYEVLNVPPPTAGYGTGFGLAIEARGADGDISVRRGAWKAEGEGVQVVRGRLVEGEMKYETQFFPTKSKTGRIVLRREKTDVVLLTADKADEPAERTRVPFSTATVRAVRVYADCGGSATLVDGRITGLRVRAEEITGGIPLRERDRTPWWVIAVAAATAVVLGIGVWWVIRRKA